MYFLPTSKAKVAPMDGLTIPRSELTSLQILIRVIAKVTKIFPDHPSYIHILGDSTCVIGVLDELATSFTPYVHSRLSDIYYILNELRD